ncbi:glycosyltransferase family 2 protein [Limibacter armeniacum]|uniref:glycosyltransferase family 2 protein n=1 Tax=Limibacter armeniacum TaxID=466084 RepID=UPI002FE6B743
MSRKEDYPLVSIITVNYRQAAETLKMLKTIADSGYPNLEVIVVDNGALSDKTVAYREAYPDARVIVCKRNLGFAGGNNLGIKAASGKYLYFLNNDTALTSSSIMPLVEEFEKDESLGAASPKIRYYYTPEIIQYAGFSPIHPYTGRNKAIGKNQKDNKEYDCIMPTYSTHGAAMMVSREVIEKVGMMHEGFFLYYEELDWCAAIRRAGFEIRYIGDALVYHKESASTGKQSPLKSYYMTRNRILFMKRNFALPQFILFYTYFTFTVLPKELLKNTVKARFNNLKAVVNGFLDGLWRPA